MFLSGLFIYPIKSLKGIALTEAKVEKRGLQYDRRWMLVDMSNKFFTQREFPKMATISISTESTGLKIDANGRETLFVPYDARPNSTAEVEVWGSHCPADFVSAAVCQVAFASSRHWISALFGIRPANLLTTSRSCPAEISRLPGFTSTVV